MSENYINSELRQKVKLRANGVCEYCLALSAYAFHPFAIDHIIPESKGGPTKEENLALCCQHCNNCKYNKLKDIDPLTGNLIPLFHPIRF